jgi:hypothetical protein
MIRHLLMFRWTDDSSPEDRTAALKALRAMQDTVPSIRSITVQEALNPGEQSFDGLLEAHFDDAEGYGAYLTADSHLAAWTQYLQPVCAGLSAIQVE